MLNLNPLWSILLLSLIISLIIVLIYKAMTDQNEMKRLKEELKEHQKKMKSSSKEPDKLMKLQKEAMSVNSRYFMKSMKPTLITFIPIIIIFGWMSMHFAYEPLIPDNEFNLTVNLQTQTNLTIKAPEGLEVLGEEQLGEKVVYRMKGKKGSYFVTLTGKEEYKDKQVIISEKQEYAPVSENYKSAVFKSIELNNNKLKILGVGWIWVYIISAIVFSMGLRKVMKVH